LRLCLSVCTVVDDATATTKRRFNDALNVGDARNNKKLGETFFGSKVENT
jgi:hypothetical protein